MRAYSIDLRERIVAAVREEKQPVLVVARLFRVCRATVTAYLRQLDTEGHLRAKTSPGRPREIASGDEPALVAQLEATPDATLEEHCGEWERQRGVRVSVATMQRAILRINWRLKKRPLRRASKTRTPGRSGGRMLSDSTPRTWSSSMKRGRR